MSEGRTIARHAGTVLVGQLAVMAFGVTDTIVAGRYSDRALAALSVGSAVYITFFVAMMSVLQALLPVWAELHGARRNHELGRSVRQALYLAAIGSVLGCTALVFPGPLMRWTQVPIAVQQDVEEYLMVLALAMPPALLFRMYSTLNQSLGKPQLVTWLQALSLLLKVPLTIWFVFGGLGVPAMGAVGCAWATVVVTYGFLICSIWLVRTQPLYTPYAIWKRIERPHWPTIAEFARLGVPSGLAVMVEVTSFTLMALFIARQGTVASAAHQIAANMAAVMFMVPLSLGIATSARVSFWLGANDAKKARGAVRTGLQMGLGMALSLAAVLLLARGEIAAIYSTNAAVVALATTLLGWLALYHVGDATQGVVVFLLRSYRVTIAPLVAYCVLLWGMGLAGGYALAYTGFGSLDAQHSPAAFWMAAAIALWVLGTILSFMLWRAVRAGRHAR
ncbi:MATE family efflux transporter [Caenimonas koreensis]|uniref:Multidrug-efflux transporter n=1 Tax=Caenimonas koreensis DSM 17982 TaxID=1121255 RepID=A0A844B944_9BURK|nr:MATE family efflux transporter [Caenimonas koreensis]MRD48119.1 MATE family efflux transporter [Caenimonas koreensis DSM 17982]